MSPTPTTTMLTKNTTELRTLVEQHVEADQVIQGTYWDADEHRGCFIGCLNHSNNPSGAEERFGLPIMLQRISENIFEALPAQDAKAFFAALPDAVACDDKDLTRVGWQFLAAELRALPEVPTDIQAGIDPVIAGMDLLASGQEWAAADAAMDAAIAAVSATDADAGWAATRAVGTVAKAIWAAAAAATATDADAEAIRAATKAADVAWNTARSRQRDLLLRLIAEAPVVGGGAR